MSLLGREYLSVAITEDPPGPGDARRPTRPRGVVIRRRVASSDRLAARRDAPAASHRAAR